jgi:hypothetical protein
MAASKAAGQDRAEEGRPKHEAVAADPAGTLIAATTNVGENDEGGEELSTLKAATANPRGSFAAAIAEACMTTPGVPDEEMIAGNRARCRPPHC